MNIKRFVTFIEERRKIFIKRSAGDPPPWTKDKILQQYRFTNVQREDDKVTRWIAENWRAPHRLDEHLWFAMVVARHFNRPDTLEALGFPARWNAKKALKVLANRAADGKKNYSAAYMIVPSGTIAPKTEYLVEQVLTPMWVKRNEIKPHDGDTLASFYTRLNSCRGMGSFLTAQIIADVKYVQPLKSARDWWTWAASGPGSRRGLNRLMKRPVNASWPEAQWLEEVQALRERVTNTADRYVPSLHAQDIQNCLCEFDKYERARLGEGRPKQLYREKNDGK